MYREDILIRAGRRRNSVLIEAGGHGEMLVSDKTGKEEKETEAVT